MTALHRMVRPVYFIALYVAQSTWSYVSPNWNYNCLYTARNVSWTYGNPCQPCFNNCHQHTGNYGPRSRPAPPQPSTNSFKNLPFNNVYFPMPNPMRRPVDGPIVIPVVYGNLSKENDKYMMLSSVTLVIDEIAAEDKQCYILVDTGLGLLKNTVIGGLAAHGVKTADITDVLLTHTDVDTVGNLNLFPGARVFSGQRRFKLQYMYNDTKPPTFDTRRSGLPFTKLCDNTEVFLTPGYSAHDVSLVVNNVHSYRTFAVVGRLIADERDLETGMSMKEFSIDKEHRRLWEIARNEVLCLSDYVIPGHGAAFKVTNTMKTSLSCRYPLTDRKPSSSKPMVPLTRMDWWGDVQGKRR